MDAKYTHILRQFRLSGNPTSCERYGFGHINETYLVLTDAGPRYILQKINDHVFPDVPKLQHNIAAVTAYLRKQIEEKHGVLNLIPTLDGNTYRCFDGDTVTEKELTESEIPAVLAEVFGIRL